jgi:hypothetical protein
MQRGLCAYEVRVIGPGALLAPLLVVGCVALFVGFMVVAGEAPSAYGKVLTRTTELFFPLIMGMVTAHVVGGDAGIEWQLTLPMPYRVTVVRRVGLLLVWAAAVALCDATTIKLAGQWVVPEQFAVAQLTWLSPLLAFSALGALLVLLLRNRSASAACVGGVWIIAIVLHETLLTQAWGRLWFPFATTYAAGADFWLANRLTLLGIACLLAGAAAALLGRSEELLIGGEG